MTLRGHIIRNVTSVQDKNTGLILEPCLSLKLMLNDNHDPQRSIRYTVDEGFVLSRCIGTGTILEVCSV